MQTKDIKIQAILILMFNNIKKKIYYLQMENKEEKKNYEKFST